MQSSKNQSTINATPDGIRWRRRIVYVVFRCSKTGRRFTVEGMTIQSGKRAWAQYNYAFKGRTFTISLNAGGQGVHYAEGIRWNVSIGNWIPVPIPNKYMTVEARGAFESPCSILNRYVWDTMSCTWLCDESDVHFPLFRLTGTESPLNCWNHRLDNEPCHCEGVDGIRTNFDGFDIHVECKFCQKCVEFYSEESCLTCPRFFINKSLHGIEPHCSICLEQTNLQSCVAVREGVKKGTCMHSFHRSCISKWFTDRNTMCPICRYDHSSDFHLGGGWVIGAR